MVEDAVVTGSGREVTVVDVAIVEVASTESPGETPVSVVHDAAMSSKTKPGTNSRRPTVHHP